MRIVDPVFFEQVRELIDGPVAELSIQHDMPILEAYVQYARSKVSPNYTLVSSIRGWWCGIPDTPVSLWLDACEQAVASLRPNFDKVRELVRQGRVDPSRKQECQQLVEEFSLQYDQVHSVAFDAIAAMLAGSVVFGVDPVAVASVAAIEAEGGADKQLFLDPAGFQRIYARADWDHICAFVQTIVPSDLCADDSSQLRLFKDDHAELRRVFGPTARAVQEYSERLAQLGPRGQ